MDQTTIEMTEKRSVAVLQLPERRNAEGVQDFVREVERRMSLGRPYLVLDCSKAGQLDKLTAGLMLHCLEEAMKRNGDVKLACVSPAEQPVLGGTGATRLFETFDSVQDAVDSFHQFAVEAVAEASESAA